MGISFVLMLLVLKEKTIWPHGDNIASNFPYIKDFSIETVLDIFSTLVREIKELDIFLREY